MIGLKWTEADIDASWLRLEDSGCDGLAQAAVYFLSSDQVCSPQSHLNIRTVPPVWGFSIDRSNVGFLSQ